MKFKMNKIAAAVAVGLGTSVVGMNVAQADEILFPYIVNSPTVTTVLSVINDDDTSVRNLHYRYLYKTVDVNPQSCLEVNYKQPTSANDVVSFDTGGVLGDANGVLFEPADRQVNVKYTRPFAVFRNIKPSIAFGLVDNNDSNQAGVLLSGEALVLEFETGSAWGYKAYNAATIWSYIPPVPPATAGTLVNENLYDFSDRVETAGEVMTAVPNDAASFDDYWVPISILPWEGETGLVTRLFVTPVARNQLSGGLTAAVALTVNDPSNAGFDVMYDRDENPVSGRIGAVVTCVGRVPIQSLITGAAQQFVPYGGWSNVTVLAGQAAIFKLEFNPTSPSQWGNVEVNGSFNNAFWLRKGFREGTGRTATVVNGNGQPAIAAYRITGVNENNSPFPVLNNPRNVAPPLPAQVGQEIATAAGTRPASLNDTVAGYDLPAAAGGGRYPGINTWYSAPAATFADLAEIRAAVGADHFSTRQ